MLSATYFPHSTIIVVICKFQFNLYFIRFTGVRVMSKGTQIKQCWCWLDLRSETICHSFLFSTLILQCWWSGIRPLKWRWLCLRWGELGGRRIQLCALPLANWLVHMFVFNSVVWWYDWTASHNK